jgi:hypothetical protein
MSESTKELCPNCERPVALSKGHGHGEECGARDAECWDCVFECNQQTISLLRLDLERYQRKFGALRPGLAEGKASAKARRKLPRVQLPKYTTRPLRPF